MDSVTLHSAQSGEVRQICLRSCDLFRSCTRASSMKLQTSMPILSCERKAGLQFDMISQTEQLMLLSMSNEFAGRVQASSPKHTPLTTH